MNLRLLLTTWGVLLALASTTAAANALPPDVAAAFRSANRIMLYALDPALHEGSGFHGFRILRYRIIEETTTRQQLAAALERDVRAGGPGALCFLPHHGLRLITGRTVQDLVICYECGHLYIYATGQPMRSVGIAGDAAYLDTILSGQAAQRPVVSKVGMPLRGTP